MAEKIRVRCLDKMVFDVNAETLEPLSCAWYDAWAFNDPEAVPTMEHSEWSLRHVERLSATPL